jgi:hypothetical protein
MTHYYAAAEAQRSFYRQKLGMPLGRTAYSTLITLRCTLGRGKTGQPELVLEARPPSRATRFVSSLPLKLHIIMHNALTLVLVSRVFVSTLLNYYIIFS